MKRSFTILFVLSMLNASADDSPVLAFSGGYRIGKVFYPRFNTIIESYNQINPDNETAMKKFGVAQGYWYNVDGIMNGIYMGYHHHNYSASTSSIVSSLQTRRISLTQKAWGADFGGGAMGRSDGFLVYMGVYFATANITTAFEYSDGYRSVGDDSKNNGIFHGFALSMGLGMKYFHYYKAVGFVGGLRWHYLGGTAIGYTDFGAGASNTFPGIWNGGGEDMLPRFNSLALELGLSFRIADY